MQRAQSHFLAGGADSPQGYSGTSLIYDLKDGLVIYDWMGMGAISDSEVRVPANDETIKKYFPNFNPNHLKSSVLEYILRIPGKIN